MLVKQIDGLDPQALERRIRNPLDLLWPAIHPNAGMRPLFPVLPAELGGDHHLTLERLQRFTDQFLIRERPVHFRGIKEGDAALDRL